MIQIKNFIEKISYLESRKIKDCVIPIDEARGLRDEIAKLLVDLNNLQDSKKADIVKVEVVGGKFK
jgi:hypothetical protein